MNFGKIATILLLYIFVLRDLYVTVILFETRQIERVSYYTCMSVLSSEIQICSIYERITRL